MENISKSFSGVQVLNNVSFDLHPGELHVLAGENGAGKSTLIKILGGIHTDFGGRIFLADQEVRFFSVREATEWGITVIHQELSLIGPMNVAENIFLGREESRAHWLNKREMKQKAERLLAEMGLTIDVTRAVQSYPISIQQMIEICKALAFDSRIIVMDEPTSALTEVEVEKLFDIIVSLKQKKCGIIFISHKMDEIYRVADRITVLRDGFQVGTSTVDDLPAKKLVHWMVGRELNHQFPRSERHSGAVRLEVKQLTVPDQVHKNILRVNRVSFSVRAGEILGLAGLQGSGNSELLNGVFGTYGRMVSGTVSIDGDSLVVSAPKKAIDRGMTLLTNDRKTNGLVMEMNIGGNISLASLKKFSRWGWLDPVAEMKAAKQQIQSLRLHCQGPNQSVDTLSGGNQQKVVLAKWIETKPKVLLLDEPTRGVDVGAKHEIYELMYKWIRQGMALVLITSEMPELLAMCNRIIVMHRGEITAEFSREEATQEKILEAAMGRRKAD